MLIYGNIDTVGGFIPVFYVSPQLHRESEAMVGRYQLGDEPIRVNTSNLESQGEDLTTRTSALFWLIKGLQYDSQGDYGKALEVFQQAESQLTDWEGKREGKEILYFFIGQSALFRARDATTQEAFEKDVETAQEALTEALSINPTYIRAQIVLGSVYFARAKCWFLHNPCTEPAPAQAFAENMDQAISAYKRAVEFAPQSSDTAWAEGAAPLALGMAYRLQGEAALVNGESYEEADRFFDMAIREMQSAVAPLAEANEHRLLGQLYLDLAGAYTGKAAIRYGQGDTEGIRAFYNEAREAYMACEAQGPSAPDDKILTQKVIAEFCTPHKRIAEEELKKLEARQP